MSFGNDSNRLPYAGYLFVLLPEIMNMSDYPVFDFPFPGIILWGSTFEFIFPRGFFRGFEFQSSKLELRVHFDGKSLNSVVNGLAGGEHLTKITFFSF